MMPWADVVRLLGGDVRTQAHGTANWKVAPTQRIAVVEDSTTAHGGERMR